MNAASATILPVLLVLSVSAEQDQRLRLLPAEIRGIVGEPLIVTCEIPDHLAGFYDSSQLAFDFYNRSDVHPMDDELIDRINRTVAVLRYPALSFSWDNAHVGCYVKNNSTVYGSRRMSVYYRPAEVRITDYEVRNWETFWFQWAYNSSTHRTKSNYEGWFRNSTQLMFTRCSKSSPASNNCTVNDPFTTFSDGVVNIKVNGSNAVASTSTTVHHIQLHDVVRPGRVNGLHVRTLNDNSAVNVLVFQPPAQRSMTYNIVVTCGMGTFQLSREIEPMKRSHIETTIMESFSGLPACSNCTFSVNAWPSQGGFVSAWTNYTHLTSEQVPLTAPKVCPSCFQLVNSSTSHRSDVVIYFHPIPVKLAQGVVTGYRVHIVDHNHSRKLEMNASSRPFLQLRELMSGDDYVNLAVEARTSVGYNDSLQLNVVHIHQLRRVSSVQFIAVSVNESTVDCMWTSDPDAQHYTIFSCSGRLQDDVCHNEVRWWHVEGNMTSTKLVLPPGADSTKHIFGIALQLTDGYSSGVVWHQCTYLLTSTVSTAPSVEKDLDGCCDVLLRLRRPTCSDGSYGYIVAYTVSYCMTESDTDTGDVCDGQTVIRDVTAGLDDVNVTLTDLEPEQFYHIWVKSVSAANSESDAKHLMLKTRPGGLTGGIIGLIVGAACIVVVFTIAALSCLVRYGRLLWRKVFPKVQIEFPAHVANDLGSARDSVTVVNSMYSPVTQDITTSADDVLDVDSHELETLPDTVNMKPVCLRLLPETELDVPLLGGDLRILPSTDSHSDLAVDVDLDYAPAHGRHQTPFVLPSDSAAQPLQHYDTDSRSIDVDDGCQGDDTELQQQSTILPSTSSDYAAGSATTQDLPLTHCTDAASREFSDVYSKARVK